MTTTSTTTEEFCDVGFHWFSGEVLEVRKGNWRDRSDMVCVLGTCSDHADEVGAHPHQWWQEWLDGEGATEGYLSLS